MLVALMSVATGLAVACNYYAQPLLETIARSFDLSVNQAGFIVTTAQLGYAAGLLLLVPLGDRLERRGLIVGMSLLAAGGMVITALSTQLSMMLLGTALTGLFSVVAQLLLYRLLSAGSIVNVTSLFYLVPVITAVLDYLLLGNTLPWSGVAGMGAILLGIMMVFRAPRPQMA